MNRPRMTSAASAMLRLLLQRAGDERHRIFLSNWSSVDWQSLTFTGERHRISFVIGGNAPTKFAQLWTAGISEADFDLPGGFVADIALVGTIRARDDGAALVELEALTLVD